jgi:general secretion pathway protein N
VVGSSTALLLFAPARWLAAAVQSATDSHVLLVEPRGTVWNGSAQLIFSGGAGSTDAAALPGRVQWQLRPQWDGALAYLRADCCMPQPVALRAHWRPGGGMVRIADTQSQWPAALLSGLGTPWNTLQLDGDLHLSTQGLSVEWIQGRLNLSGQAQLVAQRVSSRLSTLKPMGSYRITLLGGPASSLRLETLEGSLQLSGGGQWVGSRLRFEGVARALPEHEGALANLLNIIGRRDGSRSIITIG